MQEDMIELGVEEINEPLEIPIDVNRAGSNPLSGEIQTKVIFDFLNLFLFYLTFFFIVLNIFVFSVDTRDLSSSLEAWSGPDSAGEDWASSSR